MTVGLLVVMTLASGCATTGRGDENVVLVLIDGLRAQEVFAGADETLMNKEFGGVENVEALKQSYWRDTPEARREALMPFMWTAIAKQGQIYGNQAKGSAVRVANTYRVSYPGYSEMTVGYADPRVVNNERKPNPSVTVLEWLNERPGFNGRIAAFGTWEVLPFILNRERCGFYINAGSEPVTLRTMTPRAELLNRLKAEIPSRWGSDPFDAIMFHSAMEYVRAEKPRVLFITFGETDEWAHEGRYKEHLDAARRADAYVRALWEEWQGMEEYRGRTTLIVAADHGRGDTPQNWKNHGKDVKGAENVWIAVLDPHTPALGERANVPDLTLSSVAATLAAAVGEDYRAAVPGAAAEIGVAAGTSSDTPARAASADGEAGTAQEDGRGYAFLGVPESEEGKDGPVLRIKGKVHRVKKITAVHEVPYTEYKENKKAGRIVAREKHEGYVYFAIEQMRCVHFDKGSGMIWIMERKKAKIPE